MRDMRGELEEMEYINKRNNKKIIKKNCLKSKNIHHKTSDVNHKIE